MKINITNKCLKKLAALAVKFHQGDASKVDIIQLQVLLMAFQSYLKINQAPADIIDQLTEISSLTQSG
jgi:hypothetical protein